MNSHSETRHLRLLVALEAAGTLQAAAKRLHLSPSALSQQLRELEDRLGGPLFERQWKRLVMTPAGRRYSEGARSLLAELSRVETETRALFSGTRSIRLAMSCLQSYRWLPAVLARFSLAAPDTEVTIIAEAATAPAEWLLERRLDVALVSGSMLREPRLVAKHLFRDELVAVVHRRHPWARLRRVDAKAFTQEHLFADERALSMTEPLGQALQGAAPRKLTIVPMTGSVSLDLVRAGLGITVMPRWTVTQVTSRRDFALVSVTKPGLWLDWSVLTRDERPDPNLAAFLEILKAAHP
jgi:LysR family transcriptional regulator for metE and metH